MKPLKTLTFLIAIFIANNMCAQPVTLDPTFGENGMTVISTVSWATAFDFDKSGNIIAAGLLSVNTVVITKTNADGIIDENFGINGQMLILEDDICLPLMDLKITNENKILLLRIYDIELDICEVILRRFNEDGSVDQTFGSNGKMNLSSLVGADFPILISSVNLENDDFMLIAVTEYTSDYMASKSYISKYNYDGEPDKGFGENGKAYLTDYETFRIHPNVFATKILRDQSILIAGYDNFGLSRGSRLAFCKLNPTGHFIADFANNGIWINDNEPYVTEHFYSVIEDINGNLMFTSAKDEYFAYSYSIHSFYSNGFINNDFGTNGCFHPFNTSSYAGAMQILQNKNKYLARNSQDIISVNNNGTLDTTFNNTGAFRIENFSFSNMKLQKADKLVVSGSFNNNFSIARLNIPHEVSIKETPYTENRITVFPNPTTGELSVVSDQFSVEKIEVFDVYGRKLLTENCQLKTTIDISHLNSGIYFVKITTETNEIVKKIVKQ